MNSMIGGTHVEHFRELDQPVAIAGRVAGRRGPHNWNGSIPGDYHLPFGKAEAKAEAAKWLWQV